MKFLSVVVGCAIAFSFSVGATSYSGIVDAGFGGPIGLADLNLTDNGKALASGNNIFLPYAFSLDAGEIGLATESGQTFLSLGAFGSNNSNPEGSGSDTGVQAWNPFLQTTFGSYTAVPEPESLKLFVLAALAGCGRFWQIKRRQR